MLHTTAEGQNIKYFNSVSVGTEFQNDNECEGYIWVGPEPVTRGFQPLILFICIVREAEERFKRYKNQRDKSFKMLRTRDHFEILSL